MPISSSPPAPGLKYHPDAYDFVFDALRHTQTLLSRERSAAGDDDESAHVTGPELLHGIRALALDRYGLMARYVFSSWGVRSTHDFGRIVFQMVADERMRKTDRDRLSDFEDVYEFAEALDREYQPQTEFLPWQ